MTLEQAPHTTSVRTYGHLIGGAWVETETSIDRHNPATGQLVARFADGSAIDVDRAVATARTAFDDGRWSGLASSDRARLLLAWAAALRDNAEMLAQMEASEVGKPIRMARGDIEGAIGLTEYAAALAFDIHGEAYDRVNGGDLAMVLREPVGVVAAIVPWNFPALIYAQKVPFALAAGCTVIVKPSELTSGTALEMTRLAHEVGVPTDVLNAVTGYGAKVGQRISEHADVDMISFTGSTATGRAIATAPSPNHKRLSFELGGKGSTIVFDDADLDDAVDGVLFGAYLNQGETCCAGSRLIIQDTIANEFVGRLSRRAAALKVGDIFDDGTDIGAMIHEAHLDKVLDYIEAGQASGATLVTGGQRLLDDGRKGGLFVAPTILDYVDPGASVFQEEIFGPVLATARFSTVAEAIELANNTVYGLANGVWTKNVDRAVEVGRALRSGTVWINTANDGAPQLPFGGYKDSGSGREKGRPGLEEFLENKTFHIHVGARTPYFDSEGVAATEVA